MSWLDTGCLSHCCKFQVFKANPVGVCGVLRPWNYLCLSQFVCHSVSEFQVVLFLTLNVALFQILYHSSMFLKKLKTSLSGDTNTLMFIVTQFIVAES